MIFNVEITKIENIKNDDVLVSRNIAFTITKGSYSYEGVVNLDSDEILLSIPEQKALAKSKIKVIAVEIRRNIDNAPTINDDSSWNANYDEDV